MKKIELYIDTSSNNKTIIELDIDGKKEIMEKNLSKASQNLLPLIEEFLSQKQLTLKDMTSIRVNKGPGSFTGLRVGIAVANALGYLLKIPINGSSTGSFILPEYEK